MEVRIVCVKAWIHSSGSKACVCDSLDVTVVEVGIVCVKACVHTCGSKDCVCDRDSVYWSPQTCTC